MRITKNQLRQIIKEELSGVMLEGENTWVDQAWQDGREADWFDHTLDAVTSGADYLTNFTGDDRRSADWKNLKRGASYVASGGDPADEEAFYNQWRSEQQPVGSVLPIGTGLPSYEEYAAKKERVASGEIPTYYRSDNVNFRPRAWPGRPPVRVPGQPKVQAPLWDPFLGDTE